jgi:hypothetical protein
MCGRRPHCKKNLTFGSRQCQCRVHELICPTPGKISSILALPFGSPPFRHSDSHARKLKFAERNQLAAVFKVCARKYLACFFLKNSNSLRIPPRQEGRIANVTTREAGMRWTRRR